MNTQINTQIADKIYNHFRQKYPSLIDASGLSTNTINQIIKSVAMKDKTTINNMKRESVEKIISIIDTKFTQTANSNNRKHQQFDTSGFNNDNSTKISQESYLKNFNTKITGMDIENMTNYQSNNNSITPSLSSINSNLKTFNKLANNMSNMSNMSNTDRSTFNGIGANSASANISQSHTNSNNNSTNNHNSNNNNNNSLINPTTYLVEDMPFNENFPSRNREKDTDMLIQEVREFDFYVMVDSKDRDRNLNNAPNEFVIHFAPYQSSSNGEGPYGYVDRAFGNVKSCEITDIIILDTSSEPDSSDTGGKSYPYLLLKIPELGNNYFGTNNNLTTCFAILTDYCTKGNYKYYSIAGMGSNYAISKVFNPRINLSKMTISILLPDGTPFNFGSANNDNINTVIKIGFRITTIQKNLSTQFINKNT